MTNVEKYQHAGMTIEIDYDSIPGHAKPTRLRLQSGRDAMRPQSLHLGDEQVSGDDFTTSVTCPNCVGTGENTARARLWRRHSYGMGWPWCRHFTR